MKSFRPHSGTYLYHQARGLSLAKAPRRFRPHSGTYLNHLAKMSREDADMVFPSPFGDLSISSQGILSSCSGVQFPSPFGELSISSNTTMPQSLTTKVSVPIRGLIYIIPALILLPEMALCFRPHSGTYLYHRGRKENQMNKVILVSVPIRGII